MKQQQCPRCGDRVVLDILENQDHCRSCGWRDNPAFFKRVEILLPIVMEQQLAGLCRQNHWGLECKIVELVKRFVREMEKKACRKI